MLNSDKNAAHLDSTRLYKKAARKKLLVLFALSFLLLASFIYSIGIGTVEINLKDQLISQWQILSSGEQSANEYIFFHIRLPRVLMTVITGISLACAGVLMQALLRNPLASPFTLGVSSGAAFGAALSIVLSTSILGVNIVSSERWVIAVNAFIFGCIAVFAVYGISRLKNGSTTVLLLSGVAIGQLFSAGVSSLQYFSSNAALKDLMVWLMGGFWGASWEVLNFLVPLVLVTFLILWRLSWDLNALSSGEEIAKSLGIDIKKLRVMTLLLSTLIASASIAFTGIIGFIGLVAPHIGRMIIGTDTRFLLPCASTIGAILLLLSDTLARTIISPIEIPVGIITSVLGAPFFIYLLMRKQKDYWA
ncbi:iron ABC transporter permease [Halobacillus salinarum]|uniref:Iron ABC transporter permease n=1 Tax=Halobacillus salinarum TaxID=2932257 RepID=A0ABY4EQC6_9BACI|nr:iron ABC transporter permease [Halobacillus salinarum]UOQ44306.1 iron ABC transporter permease [Halobacillus salinarum]